MHRDVEKRKLRRDRRNRVFTANSQHFEQKEIDQINLNVPDGHVPGLPAVDVPVLLRHGIGYATSIVRRCAQAGFESNPQFFVDVDVFNQMAAQNIPVSQRLEVARRLYEVYLHPKSTKSFVHDKASSQYTDSRCPSPTRFCEEYNGDSDSQSMPIHESAEGFPDIDTAATLSGTELLSKPASGPPSRGHNRTASNPSIISPCTPGHRRAASDSETRDHASQDSSICPSGERSPTTETSAAGSSVGAQFHRRARYEGFVLDEDLSQARDCLGEVTRIFMEELHPIPVAETGGGGGGVGADGASVSAGSRRVHSSQLMLHATETTPEHSSRRMKSKNGLRITPFRLFKAKKHRNRAAEDEEPNTPPSVSESLDDREESRQESDFERPLLSEQVLSSNTMRTKRMVQRSPMHSPLLQCVADCLAGGSVGGREDVSEEALRRIETKLLVLFGRLQDIALGPVRELLRSTTAHESDRRALQLEAILMEYGRSGCMCDKFLVFCRQQYKGELPLFYHQVHCFRAVARAHDFTDSSEVWVVFEDGQRVFQTYLSKRAEFRIQIPRQLRKGLKRAIVENLDDYGLAPQADLYDSLQAGVLDLMQRTMLLPFLVQHRQQVAHSQQQALLSASPRLRQVASTVSALYKLSVMLDNATPKPKRKKERDGHNGSLSSSGGHHRRYGNAHNARRRLQRRHSISVGSLLQLVRQRALMCSRDNAGCVEEPSVEQVASSSATVNTATVPSPPPLANTLLTTSAVNRPWFLDNPTRTDVSVDSWSPLEHMLKASALEITALGLRRSYQAEQLYGAPSAASPSSMPQAPGCDAVSEDDGLEASHSGAPPVRCTSAGASRGRHVRQSSAYNRSPRSASVSVDSNKAQLSSTELTSLAAMVAAASLCTSNKTLPGDQELEWSLLRADINRRAMQEGVYGRTSIDDLRFYLLRKRLHTVVTSSLLAALTCLAARVPTGALRSSLIRIRQSRSFTGDIPTTPPRRKGRELTPLGGTSKRGIHSRRQADKDTSRHRRSRSVQHRGSSGRGHARSVSFDTQSISFMKPSPAANVHSPSPTVTERPASNSLGLVALREDPPPFPVDFHLIEDDEDEGDEDEDEELEEGATRGILIVRDLGHVGDDVGHSAIPTLQRLHKGSLCSIFDDSGKPVKKWLSVSKDGTNCRFQPVSADGKKKSLFKNRKISKPLADVTLIRFGTEHSPRFFFYNNRKLPPWLGFSMEIAENPVTKPGDKFKKVRPKKYTVDIVNETQEDAEMWFLGLQALIPLNQANLSPAGVLWARARLKVSHRATLQQWHPAQYLVTLLSPDTQRSFAKWWDAVYANPQPPQAPG